MGKWMSMKQICEYLGISRDTATKWIRTKGMPAHQIDRIWRFDKEEVDEWMKNNGKPELFIPIGTTRLKAA